MTVSQVEDVTIPELARRLERSEWTVRNALRQPRFAGRATKRWGRVFVGADLVRELADYLGCQGAAQ